MSCLKVRDLSVLSVEHFCQRVEQEILCLFGTDDLLFIRLGKFRRVGKWHPVVKWQRKYAVGPCTEVSSV